MRRDWFLLAAGAALALLPFVAAAERSPWNTDQVADLASRLVEQTQRLEADLRVSVAKAEAATADPDREVGVGARTVVIADLAILESRAKSYVGALESGLAREETRSLFGRIESLMSLTTADLRSLPDFASYRANLEALEGTVAALGRFYAEALKVRTPPDPLKRPDASER